MKHPPNKMHWWLALTILFISQTPTANAATISVAANLTEIQTALASAQEGDTISIAAGTVDLNTTSLTLDTRGVTIQGAGPGQTIFSSSSSSLDIMLFVYTGTPDATTPPIIIEGITFINSALTDVLTAAVGPTNALVLAGKGYPGNPSLVRNCQFLKFAQDAPALILLANYWTVEGNLFDGNRLGYAANIPPQDGLTVTGNTFTRFLRGMEIYGNVSLGVKIVGNTFENPSNFAPPLAPAGATYLGMLLSDGANTANEDRQFTITNNRFSGLDLGINFLKQSGAPAQSLTGVNITLNAFVNFRAGNLLQYIVVDNSALKVAAIENWYGDASGPVDPSINFINVDPFEPWIARYTDDPEKSGEPGFWPINIVLGNSVTPTLISLVVNSQPVFGPFTVNVTVADIPYGASFVVTSLPDGVLICSPYDFAGNGSVSLNCTTNATFSALDPAPVLVVTVISTARRAVATEQTVRVISSVPAIGAFAPDPLVATPPFPATVNLTVFLQGFLLEGTVTFPNLPEGISCPDAAYETLQPSITVQCTVSNLTTGAYSINVTVTTSAGFSASRIAQLFVINTVPQCTSGRCCNRTTQQFRPEGSLCGAPAHDCGAQGICSGNSSECQSRPAPDRTPCAWQPGQKHDRGGWSPLTYPYAQQQPVLLSAFMRDDSRLKTFTVNESDATTGAANTKGSTMQYNRRYGGGKGSYGPCVGSCLAGMCVIRVDHPFCCRPKQPDADKWPVWYTPTTDAQGQREHKYDKHHRYNDKHDGRRHEGYQGNSRLGDHGPPDYHHYGSDDYKHKLQCWE